MTCAARASELGKPNGCQRALAEHVCQRVPNCMPHFLQGVGHAAGHVAAGHVMATVTRAAAGKALS
jgi:hypothetical protein